MASPDEFTLSPAADMDIHLREGDLIHTVATHPKGSGVSTHYVMDLVSGTSTTLSLHPSTLTQSHRYPNMRPKACFTEIREESSVDDGEPIWVAGLEPPATIGLSTA